MINAIDLYLSVMDKVAEEQNGSMGIARYNRFSKMAELRLMDYLTGDVAGIQPPENYTTLKDKDFTSPFVAKHTAQVQGGVVAKPSDYYEFENAWVIGSYRDKMCEEPALITGDNTPIELTDNDAFDERNNSYILNVKPTMKKPIMKMDGDGFYFSPKDLGSVIISYKRLPIFGEIKIKHDNEFNQDVPDEVNSVNYQWPMGCAGLLEYYIMQQYPTRTREVAFTQQLNAEGKSARG